MLRIKKGLETLLQTSKNVSPKVICHGSGRGVIRKKEFSEFYCEKKLGGGEIKVHLWRKPKNLIEFQNLFPFFFTRSRCVLIKGLKMWEVRSSSDSGSSEVIFDSWKIGANPIKEILSQKTKLFLNKIRFKLDYSNTLQFNKGNAPSMNFRLI